MYCLLFYMYITFNQVYTVYPHLQYIVLRHFQVKALEKKKWTSQLSVNQPEPGPQILVGMGMVVNLVNLGECCGAATQCLLL